MRRPPTDRAAAPPTDSRLRVLEAGNEGPFTLDGTRTYLVGRSRLAVIDPGPDVDRHVRAVVSLAREASSVVVLLTHGHGDHAGAAPAVARELDAPVLGSWAEGAGEGGSGSAGPPADVDFSPLHDGEAVETDAGPLVALRTPGHTPDHLAFHWPARRTLLAGDLLLGRGDTTWVAGYPGCVADYLESLRRVRTLDPDVILPAHGPPLEDPQAALDRFDSHRRGRIRQVRTALEAKPDATPEDLLEPVYGDSVPPALRSAALMSLEALLEHVRSGH